MHSAVLHTNKSGASFGLPLCSLGYMSFVSFIVIDLFIFLFMIFNFTEINYYSVAFLLWNMLQYLIIIIIIIIDTCSLITLHASNNLIVHFFRCAFGSRSKSDLICPKKTTNLLSFAKEVQWCSYTHNYGRNLIRNVQINQKLE